ncbi:MAG: hypothetical protein ABIO38_08810 [Luteimonas sp.]
MKPATTAIALALICLAFGACTAPSAPESAAMPAKTPEHAAESPAAPAPESKSVPAPNPENSTATSGTEQASIGGAIRIGTRAAPAMRVCAMALDGSRHHCTTTSAGAVQYRIDAIPAGRYHLIGWVRDGDMKLLAHAAVIRCVMAPCPPDELRVVEVAGGQAVTGIDLMAPYSEVPAGWPGEPMD